MKLLFNLVIIKFELVIIINMKLFCHLCVIKALCKEWNKLPILVVLKQI